MSWAEWLISIPGTSAQKSQFYACVGCHTPAVITKSTHEAEEWPAIIVPHAHRRPCRNDKECGGSSLQSSCFSERSRIFGEYLSSINLSHGRKTWDYDLKILPRPTGKATKAIVTEYDLPRSDALPGDVVRDEQGMIWYLDFATATLGRMDPRTGAVQGMGSAGDEGGISAGRPGSGIGFRRQSLACPRVSSGGHASSTRKQKRFATIRFRMTTTMTTPGRRCWTSIEKTT